MPAILKDLNIKVPNWPTNVIYQTHGLNNIERAQFQNAADGRTAVQFHRVYHDRAVPNGVLPWAFHGAAYGADTMPWAGGLPSYVAGHGNQIIGHSSDFGSQLSASYPGTRYVVDGTKPAYSDQLQQARAYQAYGPQYPGAPSSAYALPFVPSYAPAIRGGGVYGN